MRLVGGVTPIFFVYRDLTQGHIAALQSSYLRCAEARRLLNRGMVAAAPVLGLLTSIGTPCDIAANLLCGTRDDVAWSPCTTPQKDFGLTRHGRKYRRSARARARGGDGFRTVSVNV